MRGFWPNDLALSTIHQRAPQLDARGRKLPDAFPVFHHQIDTLKQIAFNTEAHPLRRAW
jgi:hypothetical protein